MNTWTAIYDYDPDDKVWLVRIAEDDRVHSYGRTIAEASRHIRDAAALWAERPVKIVDRVTPPPAAAEAVERFRKARSAFMSANDELATAQADAVGALRVAGFSMREAAGVLGISHQRVGQVGKAAAARKVPIKKATPRKRASTS